MTSIPSPFAERSAARLAASPPAPPPAVSCEAVHKAFRRRSGEQVRALDGVSFACAPGTLTALVGPDGAGKTTILRLLAGLLSADSGCLQVLGLDPASSPQTVQNAIGYMPQKFGLYEDLSVQENLDLYADLHGIPSDRRAAVYPRLMEMTQLGRFRARLAGKLSGGMKQKLGLACTLVRSPELLLLDEPTVGVDPLSRRELWQIVLQLVREDKLTLIVSTSYLDEAEYGDQAVVFDRGVVLEQGSPREITSKASGRTFLLAPPPGCAPRVVQARLFALPETVDAVPQAGRVRLVRDTPSAEPVRLAEHLLTPEPVAPRFEDAFMILLRGAYGARPGVSLPHGPAGAFPSDAVASSSDGTAVAVEVHDLVRSFGDFKAVDHVSFQVRRGEIFGLLGANGAGKSTTFRLLCGLLPASGGTLRVAGADLRAARAQARAKLGYVAQKFSLYGQLSVDDNLRFFASAYGLRGRLKEQRVEQVKKQFELDAFSRLPGAQLPGGFKQRLAMAAALLHEPEILFLDEATSGADPLARREFWDRITALSENGVTVIVTTHFMEEAEYCDRVLIMDAGRALIEGTPAQIRAHAPESRGEHATMEDAFIAIVEKARRQASAGEAA